MLFTRREATNKQQYQFMCFINTTLQKLIKKRYQRGNRKRTDNTMTNRKKDKRKNNDVQNIHVKLQIE